MVGEIQIRNVKKKFENPDGSEVVALDNVNFSVKPGSFISLIGPSGCGKTTLLRAIAGLNLPDEGAIYLDGGLKQAATYVKNFLLQDIEHKQRFHDAKSKLQEYVQKHKLDLTYELLAEEGPDHNKQFTVRVVLNGKEMSRKVAHSKKTAEQYAAFETLEMLHQSTKKR